jgi:flavodoxin
MKNENKFSRETILMKFVFTSIAMVLFFATAGGNNAAFAAQSQAGDKILVAYFSLTGNTRVVAESIQKETGGDIFEIKTVQTYPKEYRPLIDMAKREQQTNFRPALATNVDEIDTYDIIFLGYPNWWGTMPMALFTFLEKYDFAGKTIIPFCTHNGSRFGSSVADIKKLYPDTTILDGLALRGGRSGSFEFDDAAARSGVQKEVLAWLNRLGVAK